MTITELADRETVRRATDAFGRPLRWARLADQSVSRSADDGDPIGFKGTAIVFNTWARIGSERWGFFEQIAPEAVTKTLQEADVRFLQDHNPSRLLARTSAGTLRLTANDQGVQVDADMAPTTYAQDAAVLLERGDLDQMSFSFDDIAWSYEERDGEDYYTITELRLYDVSIVTFPAYETTSAGLRSIALDVLCRSAGLDSAAQRRLIRSLTDGDLPPDDLNQRLEQILSAPDDTTRTSSGPDDTTRTDEQPDDTTAAEHRDAPNPGDVLRLRSYEQQARLLKEQK
jgi:hypothetical protein